MHQNRDNRDKTENTLFLSNIPPKQNSITTILQYYKRYGEIKGIWSVGTEACIIFASNESALTAYKDPNSFLGNRFINVEIHPHPTTCQANIDRLIDQKLVARHCAQVQYEEKKHAEKKVEHYKGHNKTSKH